MVCDYDDDDRLWSAKICWFRISVVIFSAELSAAGAKRGVRRLPIRSVLKAGLGLVMMMLMMMKMLMKMMKKMMKPIRGKSAFFTNCDFSGPEAVLGALVAIISFFVLIISLFALIMFFCWSYLYWTCFCWSYLCWSFMLWSRSFFWCREVRRADHICFGYNHLYGAGKLEGHHKIYH